MQNSRSWQCPVMALVARRRVARRADGRVRQRQELGRTAGAGAGAGVEQLEPQPALRSLLGLCHKVSLEKCR